MKKRFQKLAAPRLMGFALAALLAGGGLTGCGAAPEQASRPAQSYPQLKVVGILSGRFLTDHQGRPPRNREELTKFLEAIPKEWQGLGMTSVDEFLKSPRDGQPLVLVVGDRAGPLSPSGLPWVAYEQTGVNGQRFAINARGGVVEMSTEELNKLFPPSQ